VAELNNKTHGFFALRGVYAEINLQVTILAVAYFFLNLN
jgi:hypothetical protein